ncbi:monovalent cation/H+ antiporter subunit D family protein [Halorubraceae archaeon YAN]|nr:monovalent cation/H+ antiporter subunit D family protein [Halorubraceae archaeon YAN]
MSDVVLPLLVALPIMISVLPLIFGLKYENAGWPIAMGGSLTVLALAVYTITEVAANGRLIHALGNYPQPYGIELVGDELSTLIVLLIGLVSVLVLVYSRTRGPYGNAFHSGYLLLTGGLLGVVLTGDLFNLFVFLEITGLVTYALVASDRSGKSAYAALKYVFLGTIGASLYLIGVGYLYVATGTLNMRDLQGAIETVGYTDPLIQAAFGFILVGFALKVALFPLHTWQPDAYAYAPDSVSAYISALVSTAAAYALIRISFDVFTVEFFLVNDLISTAIMAAASVSIVVGSLLALMQTEIKRMFAYSSVAQFGMIVAAIAVANETAVFGAIIHLFGHGLMKAGLFMAAGILAAVYGARTIDEYAGLANRSPFTAASIAVIGIALIGIPPSIGFLGKWFIGLGAVEAGEWGVAFVIFVSTMLTLAYVFRIIEKLYFDPPGDPHGHGSDHDHEHEHDGAATDGGHELVADTSAVTVGMVVMVVSITIAVVALGFSWELFFDLLAPVLERFFQ